MKNEPQQPTVSQYVTGRDVIDFYLLLKNRGGIPAPCPTRNEQLGQPPRVLVNQGRSTDENFVDQIDP